MIELGKNQISTLPGDISFGDILRFLKISYKTIVMTGVVGLAFAVTYLLVTPKRYEAVAQIAMAQIVSPKNNLNPAGINVEEPNLLIARLSQPTSFPAQVLESCDVEEGENAAVTLAKSTKLVPAKGVVNIVELKAFGKSPEVALTCARAIFELIKTTQAQIVAPYIDEAKVMLQDNEERLAKAQDLITKADKSGSAIGATYLSTRDYIRFLLDEIAFQKIFINNENRSARLITPIYASNNPVSPKRQVALAIGLFGGLLLGLIIAFGRYAWAETREE